MSPTLYGDAQLADTGRDAQLADTGRPPPICPHATEKATNRQAASLIATRSAPPLRGCDARAFVGSCTRHFGPTARGAPTWNLYLPMLWGQLLIDRERDQRDWSSVLFFFFFASGVHELEWTVMAMIRSMRARARTHTR